MNASGTAGVWYRFKDPPTWQLSWELRRATMQMAAATEKAAAQGMTLSYAWGAARVA
jgi:hypothetical protein